MQPGPGGFRIKTFQDRAWVIEIRSAPCGARLRYLKISAGCGASALQSNAGLGHAEQLAGLVLGEDAGDVIIHDHDFVHLAKPLLREHSDRRRTTADAHPLFAHAIDDRRLSGLHYD